jgi:hypothetical protein
MSERLLVFLLSCALAAAFAMLVAAPMAKAIVGASQTIAAATQAANP